MNGYYDSENPGQVVTKGEYWEIYDNQSEIANSINTRKSFINLGVEDLKAEYNRIKELGIATQMTEIRFINVFCHTGILQLWTLTEILSKFQATMQKNYERSIK